MNWDQIGGKWKQLKGQAQERWGRITGDEWDRIEGTREEMVGIVQEKYGNSRERAEEEVDAWVRGL